MTMSDHRTGFFGLDKKTIFFCMIFVFGFSFPPAIIVIALAFLFWKPAMGDNLKFLKCIFPLLVLLFVSGLVTFFSDFALRDKFRDLYYFILFFSAIYIGVRLTSYLPNLKSFVVMSVVFFTFENVVYLKDLMLEFQNFENINKLRDALGQRSTLPAVMFFPFLFMLPPVLKRLFLASTFLSFLNFSRSNILTAFCFFLNLELKKKVMYFIGFVFVVPLVLAFVGLPLIQSYIEKTEKTFSELFSKRIDTTEDLNEKWRAYERFIVAREMDNEDFLGNIFGKGLGATAYSDFPKRTDATSSEYIVDIPVFHDSTLFIRLKTGYFGLLLWYCFWALVFVELWPVVKNFETSGYLKSGNLFYFSVLTVVFVFMYSHGYPLMRHPQYMSVVVGYLFGLKNKQ